MRQVDLVEERREAAAVEMRREAAVQAVVIQTSEKKLNGECEYVMEI